METKYVDYLTTSYGIFEILCDDEYVRSIKIVKQPEAINPNYLTVETINQLQLYFDQKLDKFDLPLYFENTFRGRVCAALYDSGIGTILSYKQLGDKLGSNAYQAIGSAMATNKYCIVVPCHNVVKTDGSLGEYYYGVKMKKDLIFKEQRAKLEKKLYETKQFPQSDIDQLLKFKPLNKMFDLIEIETSRVIYKSKFLTIVSQIIYQQVALKTAQQCEYKLYNLVDYQLDPLVYLELSDADYKKCGISASKAKYIRNFCEYVMFSTKWSQIDQLSDQEIYDELIQIVGIGRWTIEMFLLFGLERLDVFSNKDLILMRGLKELYGFEYIDDTIYNQIINEIPFSKPLVAINMWKYVTTPKEQIG